MGEHERPAKRTRRKFSDELKRDAVEIVRTSGQSIAEVARELGIYDSSLGNWVRQDQINRGERDGLTSDDKARLGELERENARLRMERELRNSALTSSSSYAHAASTAGSIADIAPLSGRGAGRP